MVVAASVNRPFFYEYVSAPLVGLSVGGYLLYY